jgi:hypothetical protein
MKRLAITPDFATLEVPAPELGYLADLVERELGRQEQRTEPLSDEDTAFLNDMFKAITQTLSAIWEEEERRGAPFTPGEAVEMVPQHQRPDISRGVVGVVVSQNRPDPRHDYHWCIVRLDDGRELEFAAFEVRRPATA